jgi:hypothetical protein
MAGVNTALRDVPELLPAMHAFLLHDACDALAVAGADTDAFHICRDAVFSDTVLTDRLVNVFVTTLVTYPFPDRAHPAIVHMLRQPLAYRYATVAEHALRALLLVQAPSQAVVEALLDVAHAVEPQFMLHESEVRA